MWNCVLRQFYLSSKGLFLMSVASYHILDFQLCVICNILVSPTRSWMVRYFHLEKFFYLLCCSTPEKRKRTNEFEKEMKAQIFHFQFNQLNFAAFSKTYHGIDDRQNFLKLPHTLPRMFMKCLKISRKFQQKHPACF